MLRHEYPLLLKTIFSCLITLQTCTGQNTNPYNCSPSSCGNISKISYPFRLKNDPPHCGHLHYELECQDNTTVLYLESHKYLVLQINYTHYTIRLTYPSILENRICSLPNYPIISDEVMVGNYYAYSQMTFYEQSLIHYVRWRMNFISCPQPVNSSQLVDVGAECGLNVSDTNKHMYIGYLTDDDVTTWPSKLMDNCTIHLQVTMVEPSGDAYIDKGNLTLSQLHRFLANGSTLSWATALCGGRCRFCDIDGQTARCVGGHWCFFGTIRSFQCGTIYVLGIVTEYGVLPYLALRTIIGILCLVWLIIHKLRRQHLSTFDIIEGFLQNTNNNLKPIRYSYRDIKRMTSGFRHKLGQGGYGSVYKGKLRSGQIVAVKLLLTKKSRDNGQDFINEIAAIGRIHHVNVVKLVGFYAGRMSNKRALVFDFMPNGSLERYIFTESPKPLSWEKKYEIAVGVAKGIDYLHRGCDIQILHFDIKPHNILLDEDFMPKISDFGLARLYSTEKNTVTLTAARGTIGYVAPELINRSIGGVSYKADVYSFGMLLMEMVGLNRDIMGNDDESSQYFPHWIYDRFEKGKDIESGEAYIEIDDDEHEKRIERKMTVVGLWCIRMSPADRPSMSEVVKMLESPNAENIQIPPRPSVQPTRIVNYSDGTSGTEPTGSVALLGGVSSSEISNDGH
ncbi:kinase [Striga asiatica]|uniref:Kinase n=1 Tax=Striga asiatica TaxID=4170 RepID=A0A5A7QMH5_STRAF|nr:kinase [Striga asiatica]